MLQFYFLLLLEAFLLVIIQLIVERVLRNSFDALKLVCNILMVQQFMVQRLLRITASNPQISWSRMSVILLILLADMIIGIIIISKFLGWMCTIKRWNNLLFHISKLSTIILYVRSFKRWDWPCIGHLVLDDGVNIDKLWLDILSFLD